MSIVSLKRKKRDEETDQQIGGGNSASMKPVWPHRMNAASASDKRKQQHTTERVSTSMKRKPLSSPRRKYSIRILSTIISLLLPSTVLQTPSSSSSTAYENGILQGQGSHVYQSTEAIKPSQIVKRAHSHNDYHQKEPLRSALRHGLRSVEVDVFSRDGMLLVGHTRFELDPSRTIESMYIQPILQMLKNWEKTKENAPRESFVPNKTLFKNRKTIRRRDLLTKQTAFIPSTPSLPENIYQRHLNNANTQNDEITQSKHAQQQQQQQHQQQQQQQQQQPLGELDDGTLILLVDFKSNPDITVHLLQKALQPLQPYLSKVDRHGTFIKGLVTICISGHRPKDHLLIPPSKDISSDDDDDDDDVNHQDRYIFIDGRTHDIRRQTDRMLVPLVSVDWRMIKLAKWMGRGEEYLNWAVGEAHDQGRIVRVWGAPNTEEVWEWMRKSEVDLWGIDDHDRFERFAMTRSIQTQFR